MAESPSLSCGLKEVEAVGGVLQIWWWIVKKLVFLSAPAAGTLHYPPKHWGSRSVSDWTTPQWHHNELSAESGNETQIDIRRRVRGQEVRDNVRLWLQRPAGDKARPWDRTSLWKRSDAHRDHDFFFFFFMCERFDLSKTKEAALVSSQTNEWETGALQFKLRTAQTPELIHFLWNVPTFPGRKHHKRMKTESFSFRCNQKTKCCFYSPAWINRSVSWAFPAALPVSRCLCL